jgi:succinate dehydrogenase / fumarate reductase cytochrome b subunit
MMSSSIGKKVVMSLTGLFLITFLVVHLSGNLQLLAGDDGKAFNLYADFMSKNPLIQVVSKVNFVLILMHVVYGFMLASQNTQARPERYRYNRPGANSSWASRNMTLLGTVLLVFIVVHLANFWFPAKYGTVAKVSYDGQEYKDLYLMTKEAFAQWWLVALYIIAMGSLAFHLSHGFVSAFRSLGLDHKKYTPILKFVGLVFCIIVPLAFALIPAIMFIQQMA